MINSHIEWCLDLIKNSKFVIYLFLIFLKLILSYTKIANLLYTLKLYIYLIMFFKTLTKRFILKFIKSKYLNSVLSII